MRYKVVSSVMNLALKSGESRLLEHTEIEDLLHDGWEIVDTLPPYSSGEYYVLSCILQKEERRGPKPYNIVE